MVEGCVEAALLLSGASFHAQLAESRLPCAVGTLAGSVEVRVPGSIKILDGAFDVDAADSHLQLQLLDIGQLHPCLG